MLPIATGQCSIGFSVLQSILGGTFGSLGFIANLLVLKSLMGWWQRTHGEAAATAPDASSMPRRVRRLLNRR